MVRARAMIGLATAALLAASAAQALASGPPVVLELFTSQGCSACPPADALLGRLAARDPDLLPLSLHVDYWNRAGWRDPFSSKIMTARQQAYASALGQEGLYTPELVVGGTRGMVGSDEAAVTAAIRRARAGAAPGPALHVVRSGTGAILSVAVGPGSGRGWVVLVGYDGRHVTAVPDGENAGATLVESNVVRSLAPIAAWSGTPLALQAPVPDGERAAVLLQAADGRIMAAAMLK